MRINSMNTYLVLCIVSLFLLAGIVASCSVNKDSLQPSNIAQSLSGNDTAGFARADASRDFIFPEDFGPHPEFQTEWWYYTGNLSTEEGREFGYQLTFFRRALSPEQIKRDYGWASNQK
ncbi:MAG: lipocalin-like domain-containing protein [Thermodesulfobacteriota bacterium]